MYNGTEVREEEEEELADITQKEDMTTQSMKIPITEAEAGNNTQVRCSSQLANLDDESWPSEYPQQRLLCCTQCKQVLRGGHGSTAGTDFQHPSHTSAQCG